MQIHSFDPVISPSSRVLVLGSMPGKASLRAGQYYAHPRNLFWGLIEETVGVARAAPYSERIAQLQAHDIALWDVLRACTRETSLDSDIVSSSAIPNDFSGLFTDHPSIDTVCFNGLKAAELFDKHVRPRVAPCDRVVFHKLPSTSPANASISWETKLEAWRVVSLAV